MSGVEGDAEDTCSYRVLLSLNPSATYTRLKVYTIELVLLSASVVLGIVHITIMSHLQTRKGLAIGRVAGNCWQRVI